MVVRDSSIAARRSRGNSHSRLFTLAFAPPRRLILRASSPPLPSSALFRARRVVQSASITLSSLGICDMAVTCRLICRMVEVTMSMDVNPMDTPAAARV